MSASPLENWAEREHRVLWHPNTQMRDWEAEAPLCIVEGRGCRVRDRDGRWYYDANSSLWVNVHGHGHPTINRAIREQLARISHTTFFGLSHEPALLLAERLVAIAPRGLTRVFYSESGAESVEIALKMAFQFWVQSGQPGRTRFVALRGGYHGDTLGAVSVGAHPLFRSVFGPLLFRVDFVRPPATARGLTGALERLDALLGRRAGRVAGVVLEPVVQAAGGMLITPPGYLRGVRDVCSQRDVLLIADEVATGFGRTGRMFACEHDGVTPDLMCLAKGLTGGTLPLAVTLATERVYDAFMGEFSQFRALYHGHSYTANPLGCAAALGSLQVFEEEDVLASLPAKCAAAAAGLRRIRRLSHVSAIRRQGLMAGIDLVAARRPRREYPVEAAMGFRVCRRARNLGLITRPLGHTLVFMPPLCSTPGEIGEMLSILETAIRGETEG